MKSSTKLTLHSGLMSLTRSAITSILLLPIVPVMAWI
ncbi:Uncharacterised protein [Vibrio cholerae]|nr:Uncharacterised protein [Vibrio cholerae]